MQQELAGKAGLLRGSTHKGADYVLGPQGRVGFRLMEHVRQDIPREVREPGQGLEVRRRLERGAMKRQGFPAQSGHAGQHRGLKCQAEAWMLRFLGPGYLGRESSQLSF